MENVETNKMEETIRMQNYQNMNRGAKIEIYWDRFHTAQDLGIKVDPMIPGRDSDLNKVLFGLDTQIIEAQSNK